jgi:hypothetical protein
VPNFNPLCGETSKQISARIMSKAWTKSESNNNLSQEWQYLKDKYGYKSLTKDGDVWIAEQ